MRLRRTSLMNSVALRHLGVTRIDPPAGAQGAGGTGQTTNNPPQGSGQTGNSTQQGQQGDKSGNNGTPQFDAGAFWAQSEAPKDGSPGDGSSADSNKGGSGTQQETPQQTLVKAIQGYQPGEAFTKEIGDQIANGDLSGVNKSIQNLLQQNMQQTLQFAAQMMKMYGEKQQKDFGGLVDQRFGSRDNTAALSESFPSYKEPGMKPVIDGIYSKALENSKGDRAAAIDMTRHMLKFVGNAGASDLGIPPNSHTDTGTMTSSAKSLVDELLSGN